MKSNYGQKMQGIVQDRSASGETLFLEPLFAVEMNNRSSSHAREEERIVQRILADLTGAGAPSTRTPSAPASTR